MTYTVIAHVFYESNYSSNNSRILFTVHIVCLFMKLISVNITYK